MRPLLLAPAPVAALLLAGSGAALAQTADIQIDAHVTQSCVLGSPSATELDLGDLTGPDGRLSAALASGAPSLTTTIDVAYCNTPSTLSLDASPLGLDVTPGYTTPAGFARLITYDATLTGWPTVLVDRPVVGDSAKTALAPAAHAASTLHLSISRLETLNAAGTGANASAVVEAGSYSGTIIIGITVQ
ncbi:MAG: hypothetical protein J0L52_01885 [Caulobacterales bacterium]|nr:hypothetical protein [Caulobacterales bacterium]